MRLFLSLQSVQEAMACAPLAQNLDMVDVKEPDEGSLGANYPWVIKYIREALPSGMRLSATLGGAPCKPGTMAQAALGAVVSGADCVQVGLSGVATPEQAIELMHGVVRAVKDYDRDRTVVAVGYADARRTGSVSPLSVPSVAHESGADGAMLNTAVSDGLALFDQISPFSCRDFVSECHGHGLFAAMTGPIQARDVPELAEIGTDMVGVPSAACAAGHRNDAVQPDRILALRQAIDEAGQSPR